MSASIGENLILQVYSLISVNGILKFVNTTPN